MTERPNYLEVIRNKTIKELKINSDKTCLIIVCDNDEEFIFRTDGDCCNQVWIEHINGIEGLPAKVFNIHDKGYIDRMINGGFLAEFGYTIIGAKGLRLDIELRNNHNGYYSGSLSYVETDYQWQTYLDYLKRQHIDEFKVIMENF